MSEGIDCFTELKVMVERFKEAAKESLARTADLATGGTPPMDEHGNDIDDSAELEEKQKREVNLLFQCITACFAFEKEHGCGTALHNALDVLEKAVLVLSSWKPKLKSLGHDWEGAVTIGGWKLADAELKKHVRTVDQSNKKVSVCLRRWSKRRDSPPKQSVAIQTGRNNKSTANKQGSMKTNGLTVRQETLFFGTYKKSGLAEAARQHGLKQVIAIRLRDKLRKRQQREKQNQRGN